MARSRTNAVERRQQRDTTVSAVSAEVGRPVSVREAANHRREQKTSLPEVRSFLTPIGEVDLTGAELKEVGFILGRPIDMKLMRGGFTQISLQTAAEFAHVLVDVQRISVGHPVLITFSEIIPAESLDDDD